MLENRNIIALITGAGRGERAGGNIPKQYASIKGQPMLRLTCNVFLNHPLISSVVVIIHPDDRQLYEDAVADLKLLPPIYGGKTRQISVCNGLDNIKKENPTHVLIHDAARPFISEELINQVVEKLNEANAVIPVIPVTDTIKRIDGNTVLQTLDRSTLVHSQTPQGFSYETILALHHNATEYDFSDDASLVELSGEKVLTVKGTSTNCKLTTHDDLKEYA